VERSLTQTSDDAWLTGLRRRLVACAGDGGTVSPQTHALLRELVDNREASEGTASADVR